MLCLLPFQIPFHPAPAFLSHSGAADGIHQIQQELTETRLQSQALSLAHEGKCSSFLSQYCPVGYCVSILCAIPLDKKLQGGSDLCLSWSSSGLKWSIEYFLKQMLVAHLRPIIGISSRLGDLNNLILSQLNSDTFHNVHLHVKNALKAFNIT